MATTIPALSLAAREEWPDADFDLNDDEPLHALSTESDKDDDDDWDVEMDLGKTGGAKAQAVVAGIAARSASAKFSAGGGGGGAGLVNIRPPIALVEEDDEDEDEGFSTIKMATLRPPNLDPKPASSSSGVPTPTLSHPGAATPAVTADDDFESDFSLPTNLTQLSLRPLSHQSSKNSLEWGDKDQTSSSQSSDAYSTLGLDLGSLSSSTQPETETEDEEEEELDGLVLPANIFDSGSGIKHLSRLLELKKTAPVREQTVKVATPDPEDDFEIGLVLSDDADFSQSRLLQHQHQHPRRSAHTARAHSLPSRPLITRPPSRLRADRAKSPTNPPPASQRALQKISNSVSPSPPPRAGASSSKSALLAPATAATAAKPGSLRGQKSHTGLNTSASPPGSLRKLTRKASLSSLMDSNSNNNNPHQPVASGSGLGSAGSSQALRYDAPTAASRAKTHSTSTGRMRGMADYGVPPTRPSTPSSNPSAVRLTLPTNMSRLKSRPPISSVFPSPATATSSRATSPLTAFPRPPSSLSLRTKLAPQPVPGPSSAPALAGPRVLRKPKRLRTYGDGTELDAFDDLPTDRDKESRFRVQPKGFGNRVPGAMYSPKKAALGDLGRGSVRRKPTRELSSSGSGPESAPRTLKRSGRIESVTKAAPPEALSKRKKVDSPHRTRRKPTLIRNLGGTGAPKVVGEMKWNPQTLRWEGNDAALRDFDAAMAPSRPALITHLTGSSVGSPVSSSGVRRVGNMIFDPDRMCWISTLAPEEDEPDVFADLADDEGDWDAQAGTIRALQTPSSVAPSLSSDMSTNTSVSGEPPSPARSGVGRTGRVRSPSESGSDRGSRASMVCDVDDAFFDQCRAAEERHRSEMRAWRGKLPDAFAGAERAYLYEIRALATRQY